MSPLEWEPVHLMKNGALDEEMVIEAWLLAKMRTGTRGVGTASHEAAEMKRRAEEDDKWGGAATAGPLLWEEEARARRRDGVQPTRESGVVF